eukprot:EG_transcript_2308
MLSPTTSQPGRSPSMQSTAVSARKAPSNRPSVSLAPADADVGDIAAPLPQRNVHSAATNVSADGTLSRSASITMSVPALPRIQSSPVSVRETVVRPLCPQEWLPHFPDDQFSKMEKAVAHEVNLCRCSPTAYAHTFEAHYVMDGPHLINKPPRETRKHLAQLIERLRRQDEDYEAHRRAREAAWMARKEELLAAITASKKNKGSKKAPPKKDLKEAVKPGTATAEDNPEDLLEREQERHDAQERQLRDQHLAQHLVAEREINAIQAALARVEACTNYLRTLPPLPWLEYTRGLALAGRAHPRMRKATVPERIGRATTVEERAAQYGTSVGAVEELVFDGVERAQQIVSALLLDDFERLEPHVTHQSLTFLRRHFAQIGVGWGQPIGDKRGGLCAIALAERFMEHRAIRDRHHLDLQCLIRELEFCQGSQHRTTQIVMKHLPTLGVVRLLAPLEHPLEISQRTTELRFEVPADVVLGACLEAAMLQAGATTLVLDGAVFVQHQGTQATAHVVVPRPGLHKVVCFAKKKGALRFEPLGSIVIRAKFNDASTPQVTLPTAHSGFGDLRCYLASPALHPLRAEAQYTFELFAQMDREAELERLLHSAQEVHREEVTRVAAMHASEMAALEAERQEVEGDLQRLRTTSAATDRLLTAPDRKSLRKGEKPRTPTNTAASPRRAPSKKGPDPLEQESRAAMERQELEKATLLRRLTELDQREARAAHEFEQQQAWMADKLARAMAEVEARRQVQAEVALVNNELKAPLLPKPGAQHWFVATNVKVKPGVVSLLVDGTFVLSWRVEHALV